MAGKVSLAQRRKPMILTRRPVPSRRPEDMVAAAEQPKRSKVAVYDGRPRFFSKSYWEKKEKRSDPFDLEIEKFHSKIGFCKHSPLSRGIYCHYGFYKHQKAERTKVHAVVQQALKKYNSVNDEAYRFHCVWNVNARVCAGYMYFITFSAKNRKASYGREAPSELFETRAYCGHGPLGRPKIQVDYCRPELKIHKLEVIAQMHERSETKSVGLDQTLPRARVSMRRRKAPARYENIIW